jgi:hypothetical protein
LGVSANASETQPAKPLAVFVVDTNETELTTHSEVADTALGKAVSRRQT